VVVVEEHQVPLVMADMLVVDRPHLFPAYLVHFQAPVAVDSQLYLLQVLI
jgi:hypothetical protein